MTKVQINSIQLKELRAVALINGTLPQWSELAIEYIDGCEDEILRLRNESRNTVNVEHVHKD